MSETTTGSRRVAPDREVACIIRLLGRTVWNDSDSRARGWRRVKPVVRVFALAFLVMPLAACAAHHGDATSAARVSDVQRGALRAKHERRPSRARGEANQAIPGSPQYMAYVASTATNQIFPVNLADGRVGRPIHVGPAPMYLAITPDGRMAYVAESGWSDPPVRSRFVTPVELPTGRVLRPIRAGLGPFALAITPDGKTAYIADMGPLTGTSLRDMQDAYTLTPIDLATDKALRPIVVGPGPGWVAITPDGHKAVVVLAGTIQHPAHSLVIVDLETGRVLRKIRVGVAPQGVAITPDGKWALVAVTGWPSGPGLPPGQVGQSLVAVDLRTGRPASPIGVGPLPLPVVVSPRGHWAYVGIAGGILPGHTGQFYIKPVDLSDFEAAPAIALPGTPLGMAITPGGHWLCVAVQTQKADGLVVVNLATRHVGPLIEAGSEVDGVAIDPLPIRALLAHA